MYLPRLTLGRLIFVGSVLWVIIVALLVTQPASIVQWLKQSGVPDPVQKFWPLSLVPMWGVLTFGLYYAGALVFKPTELNHPGNYPLSPGMSTRELWESEDSRRVREGVRAHDDHARAKVGK